MKSSENLGPLVFDTVIRKNVRIAEIAGTGKSIFKSASSSFGAEDYDRLADEVIERTGMEVREEDNENNSDTAIIVDEQAEDLVGVGIQSVDESHDTQNPQEEHHQE